MDGSIRRQQAFVFEHNDLSAQGGTRHRIGVFLPRFRQYPLQQRISSRAVIGALDERILFHEGFDQLIGIFSPRCGIKDQFAFAFGGLHVDCLRISAATERGPQG